MPLAGDIYLKRISNSLTIDNDTHIGQVGGHTDCVNATPILTVHATYVANDYVGQSGAPITFNSVVRKDGGSGVIINAILIDCALQSVSGELWLFDSLIIPPNDSAAWTLSDADAAKCIGIIPFNTYYASAANSISQSGNLSIAFKCLQDSADIYGCFVTRGAPTYASGDLTFRLCLVQD